MKLKIKLFARNIVNPEAITEFIIKVSKGKSDKIKVWCSTILKNYLKNEYDNLKDVTKVKKTDPTWLQEAVKRKDAQKIIISKDFKRLLIEHIFHYFNTLQSNSIKHSFSEAAKQTKEWENKENLFNIKLTKGVKEILKCEGGYTWFEIADEETLYNEGEIIQNCLRKKEHGPEYWKQIKSGDIKIFTLRDTKSIGHVGVEYNIKYNKIIQMNGKQNEKPIEKYHTFCIELLNYLRCDITNNIFNFLDIIFNEDQYYSIFNLPENLKIDGDLDLREKLIDKLPNNLYITGTLNIDYSGIKYLPNNLKVGTLFCGTSNLKELPDNMEIMNNFDLSRSKFTKLPKKLIVHGNFKLNFSKIIDIPDDLKVNGNLNLNSTQISKLPDNFSIGGILSLSYTKITKLPNNLKIGKSLQLAFTKITKLPDSLEVGDKIYISEGINIVCNKELKSKLVIY